MLCARIYLPRHHSEGGSSRLRSGPQRTPRTPGHPPTRPGVY